MYKTHFITGTQGFTYTLNITVESENYAAVSTMPAKVNLDAINFEPAFYLGFSDSTFDIVPVFTSTPLN